MTQKFKPNDLLEQRVADVFDPIVTSLDLERTSFYEGAFTAQPLGQVLYDLSRDPMVGVISEEVYVQSFSAIHDLFTRPGTFEFYLQLFRNIWGDNVEVDFVTPAPGVLEINIEAVEAISYRFIARRIVDNAYIYEPVIDDEGDNIVFQGTIGLKTQEEVDLLMKEISPANIFTTATLVVS